MKRLFLFFLLIGYWSVVRASDTVFAEFNLQMQQNSD